ncbi:MAG: hypothetical protein E7017_03440 [Alphaproteobacteria bacterium]|nr:hypothetical protein [Alphaproteobacteria bacterium]
MSFYWLTSLKNASETVDIIVFNCESKEEFKLLLEKDLNNLDELKKQKSASLSNIEKQIHFIETTLREMSMPVFVKEPSDDLLQVVSETVKKRLKKDDVTYLSGLI